MKHLTSIRKKSAVLLVLTLATGTLLAACAKESGTPATNTSGSSMPTASAKALEPPTPISIMSTFYGAEPPGPDNVVIKEIEKRTNTKLTITWVSPNSYNEKVNVTLASGEIPDITLIGDNFASNVRTMAAQGAFWDLEKYINDYPNLKAYPKEAYDNTRYQDGKMYAIPRVRGLEAGMLSVRKDWLDKLNLKVPQTMDDLYKVMEAFTKNDPDGNGKADTVGLVGNIDSGGLSLGSFNGIISTFQNANDSWKLDNSGKLINMTTDPSTKEAIAWLRKAYADGLIHKDFATLKNTQARESVMAGKAGVSFDAVSTGWVLTEGIRKTDPKGDMLPLVSLTGPSGNKYNSKSLGYSGVFVIPKSVPEAKLKKILTFIDYGASDEGYELGAYGFKDVHFTKDGDFYKQTEQAQKDIVSTSAFGQIFTKYNKYTYAVAPNIAADYYNRNKGIIDEISKISISSPATGLYSETWTKYRNEFFKKTTDLQVKIILGTEPLESWDAYATKLAVDPNWVKAMEEMNAAYKKKAGK
ncbi:putative aldouronate transport system substrate-binding protein [Paenibacillus sp. V4I9]|uniref:extracellular solute-binding protein n=1 Tax=Paenibacillus sp. V4I9 TaxID=3042308 RepID=UPI002781740C|nr:extracellular solute-binding protein [Paenibacillus sp. V4I9]MDQ0890414.1 putative aldouronate transport system substrate-binding protein [Paenibacillus sp. V4I9]